MTKLKDFLEKRKTSNKESFNFNLQEQLWFNYNLAFFGSLIYRGRKIWAFNTFLKIKQYLKIKEQEDPNLIFLVSMLKITPSIILKQVRKGDSKIPIAFPIEEKQKITFAIKWAIKLLKDSNKKVRALTITDALVSAIYGRGKAYEKKLETYQKAKTSKKKAKEFIS